MCHDSSISFANRPDSSESESLTVVWHLIRFSTTTQVYCRFHTHSLSPSFSERCVFFPFFLFFFHFFFVDTINVHTLAMLSRCIVTLHQTPITIGLKTQTPLTICIRLSVKGIALRRICFFLKHNLSKVWVDSKKMHKMRRGCVFRRIKWDARDTSYKETRTHEVVPRASSCRHIVYPPGYQYLLHKHMTRTTYNVHNATRVRKNTNNNYDPRTKAIGTHRPVGIPRDIQPEASECQLGLTYKINKVRQAVNLTYLLRVFVMLLKINNRGMLIK